MFGGFMFHGMDRDPFFAGAANHHAYMNDMFLSHNNMLALPSPDRMYQPERRQVEPFGFNMVGGFGGMDGMFQQMQRQMEHGTNNPNCHSFSSSSVMSYSNMGGGPPKIYQASSSTRTAPGGVKETRKMERDSAQGSDTMAIGHHIHDTGHVVQRSRNHRGNMDEAHEYYNMDEGDADAFNNEWVQKTSNHPRGNSGKMRNKRIHAALPESRSDHHRSDGRPRQHDPTRRDRQ